MDVPGGSDGEESACLLFILVDKVREQALEWASPLKSCSQPCRTGWARCLVPPAVKKILKKKKKESFCNAGDLGSIPGLGRSAGERIGYTLRYSGASLVAQLAKNLPTMQVTPVRFLGWEDPLEKGTAPHPSILAWRIPWTVQSLGSQSWT